MNTSKADTQLAFQETADGRRIITHTWPHTTQTGHALQKNLAKQVITHNDLPATIDRIAGVDIGFEAGGQMTRAAVVVLDPDDLHVLEDTLVRRPTRMPYIPGMLSFREVPAALDALAGLSVLPDLLMVDGHGIAHPRRVGVATHLGLASGLPSIGVAKKRLVGEHDPAPEQRLGWTPLTDGTETLGVVFRSRVSVKPIFISIGHRIDLGTGIKWVARSLTHYRLPETTRLADRLASGKQGAKHQLKRS